MALALVQKTAQFYLDNASSGSRTITGVTAGNLLVCLICYADGDNTGQRPPVATPSGWSVAENPTSVINSSSYQPQNAIFYKENAAGGSHTASFPVLRAGTYAEVTILEISGAKTSGALDAHGTGKSPNNTQVVSGSYTSPATTVADTIVFALCCPCGGATFANNISSPPASGYTLIDNDTGGLGHIGYTSGYKIVGATGTQSASMTWTDLNDYEISIAAFAAAAGGGGDVTRALTGQQATTARGALTAALTRALAGQPAATAQGAVTATADTTKALSGQPLATAQGTIAPSTGTSQALTAQTLATAQGILAPSVTGQLTGQLLTLAQGTVTNPDAPLPPPGGLALGFDVEETKRRRRVVTLKPILQRVLEARAAERTPTKPAKARAQHRAKAIEREAAEAALTLPDAQARKRVSTLFQDWQGEHPLVSNYEQFLAQIALRMEQAGQIEAAKRALADEDDEDVLLLLT